MMLRIAILDLSLASSRPAALRHERNSPGHELRRLHGEPHYRNLLPRFAQAQRETDI